DNNIIDKFIQDTQLSAHYNTEAALEWIPYDKLCNIEYIAENKFGKVYEAIWINGNINNWDNKNQNWKRNHNMIVNLKSLNIPLEFVNKIIKSHKFYGITQDPKTKFYMIVLDYICERCDHICNLTYFQHNFIGWTSGNDDIDKFIQNTQLLTHNNTDEVLEWIPYDRLYDVKHITKDEYGANWIDGYIKYWSNKSQNWIRNGNKDVILKCLNNLKNITMECTNEINKLRGITQNPETKNYMMVLNNNNICKKCNYVCYAIHFQHKFKDWTSGNEDIDKFIQVIQLLAHNNTDEVLEWIPYNKFDDIKYIVETQAYIKANWIDGKINNWDSENQNWIRGGNIIIILKNLNNLENITIEFTNEINKPCGITQNPETKNYMMVLNNICKKCNYACYAIHFQYKFIDWTSGNNDIDKFIQVIQLLAHNNTDEVLEWIPYDKFDDIKYIAETQVYIKANWIDGKINNWDNENQNWIRDENKDIIMKSLNNLENITIEFTNEINKPCGITQNPETKNYMMVLNYICKKCNYACYAIYFQHKFIDWTSGNDDIDKFIQDTQLLAHNNTDEVLEWIPYDKFYDIKYIAETQVYIEANWIDGKINNWDNENQNWIRDGNKDIILKNLNNLENITLEFTNEINKPYGITQNPETKNYMMILICKKCNYACYAIQFQYKFKDWTSGNDDIDKFIQDTQLLAHNNTDKVLEWISYGKFNNVKYIANDKFGNVYKAIWIDGNISSWDNKNKNWKKDHNMAVNLKGFNTPENILEFANKIKREYEFYGITQDPETKTYLLVLSNMCENYKFIQNTQLSIHSDYEVSKAVEWISYDRFYDIKYIAKGGFGEIFRATWLDGYIWYWDSEKQNWRRKDQYKYVALKRINNSENVTLEFMNEITLHYKVNDLLNSVIKFYGITQDPKTKNYIMVMNFAENGSLRKFLDESYRKLNWYDKINCLWIIAYGLNLFHKNGLIH
ncbi:hypothetical protein RhiirA1_476392, partial [Rhizophagus irregularis]